MTHYFEYLESEGVSLFTMIFLPRKEGRFPTVLRRSPYVDEAETMTEEEVCTKQLESAAPYLERGYAVVSQHCRGRGKSGGDCIPYIHEREDGLCLQAWVRKQPFYNGELYLVGSSYTASVHFVTAPFAPDIKGAVLEVQDCERYNCNYRNGFYKMGLHGGWYVKMYKRKTHPQKDYTPEHYHQLPLSDFSKTVLGEPAADFDAILRHPYREDSFWRTRYGGGEARDAIKHAHIPILLVTGFYDIYTGGVFEMWRGLDAETRALSALAVHPFDHGGSGEKQPVCFPNGCLKTAFGHYASRWLDAVRGKGGSPFPLGQVTYYRLFEDRWCTDDFSQGTLKKISLGQGERHYRYDPADPAPFAGGLSANFGGNAWQNEPHSRQDILTLYTSAFEADTFIKGQIKATLAVRSDCEDTCFYIRLSLCKSEGDYGLRDDINQISNFAPDYIPNDEIQMDFSFDDHAFLIKKGEKLRIDISSSAFPHYVRHTNYRGLFSAQTAAKIAQNTVVLDRSFIELPICQGDQK